MLFWIIFIITIIIIYLYLQNNLVSKNTYKIHLKETNNELKGKKLVFLSDSHFKTRNSEKLFNQLIEKIQDEEPNAILFGGDIIHANAPMSVLEHVKDFFFQLNNIAPVYAVYGNHDIANEKKNELRTMLKIAGVKLLKNESTWVPLGDEGTGFWLMGLYEDIKSLENTKDNLQKIAIPKKGFSGPKLLLAHHPEYFESYLLDEKKRPDIVLSGHTHGGQVVLPIVGGLFAPGQGQNPIYDFGMFSSDNFLTSRLIVTRGVGNSSFPFRINNRPEYVVLTFE